MRASAVPSETPGPPAGSAETPVWDLGVRVFHWALVAALAVAAVTGFLGPLNALDMHLIAGGVIAVLIGFRLVWGWLGGFHARFASFAFSPRTVLAYARDLARGGARRYLGHNPLGSMMVFALLAVLALIVITGVVTLGGQDKQGPLAAFVPFAIGSTVRSVHNVLAGLLLAMVAAHVAGVAFESHHEAENLTMAMVRGRKRAEPGARSQRGHADRPRPRLASVLVLGGGGAIAAGVAALAALPPLGVPPAKLDPDYARECSACHVAYHPSLAGAATWNAIMTNLQTHFGEDASLDPALVAKLGAYLAANAAEHWDTQPAVMFRSTIDPNDPWRITATRFWRRMHHAIPDTVFADKQVGRRGNCAACHADAATGAFSPQAIEIPESLQ